MNQEIIRQTPLWAENWPIAYSVIQAVVILLVVVLVAALMSFIERRLWRYGKTVMVQTVLVRVVCSRSLPTCSNHVQRRLDTKVCRQIDFSFSTSSCDGNCGTFVYGHPSKSYTGRCGYEHRSIVLYGNGGYRSLCSAIWWLGV